VCGGVSNDPNIFDDCDTAEVASSYNLIDRKWFTSNCEHYCSIDNTKRCSNCQSKFKNLKRWIEQHKIKTPTTKIMLPTSQTVEYTLLNNCINVDHANLESTVRFMLSDFDQFKNTLKSIIAVDKYTVFKCCQSLTEYKGDPPVNLLCKLYKISRNLENLSPYCEPCSNRIARRTADGEIGSKTRNDYLNDEQKHKKNNSIQNELRSLKTKNVRLHAKIERLRSAMQEEKISPSVDAFDDIKRIISVVTYQREGSVRILTALLEEHLSAKLKNTSPTIADKLKDEFEREKHNVVAFLVEQLNGQSCRFADKAKTNRYSPKLLQLAASLYTRGKSVYKDAAEFMVLPSISTMEKTKQAHSSSSGDCSNLYLNFRRRFKNHSVTGILAGDEMKLEEGIAWSTFMFNVYANTTHVSFNLRTSVSTADSFYEYIQFIGYAIVDLRKNVLRNKPTNTEIIQCLDSLVQPFSKLSDIEKGNV
jgi:hypothetical protein